MPHRALRWQVDCHVTLCAQRAHMRQAAVAIRMFDDGRGAMMIDGVCYPIRKGMTVEEHFDQVFGDAYGIPALEAWASGE